MDTRILVYRSIALFSSWYATYSIAAAAGSPRPDIDLNLPFQSSGDPTSLSVIIAEIIKFVGVISVLSLSWGGIMFASSYGEDGKIKKAKNLITYSLVGVLLSLSGYPIINMLSGLNVL